TRLDPEQLDGDRSPASPSAPAPRDGLHRERLRAVGHPGKPLREETSMIDSDEMVSMRQDDLDDLFRSSPPGEIPRGKGRGTVVFLPHTIIGRIVAKLAFLIAWQG